LATKKRRVGYLIIKNLILELQKRERNISLS